MNVKTISNDPLCKEQKIEHGGGCQVHRVREVNDIDDEVGRRLLVGPYREAYGINLKREFPRIPLYPNFGQWSAWGKTLMALHIGYEVVAPWPLTRTDTPDQRSRSAGLSPKVALKSDPAHGTIILDSETTLSGLPAQAWDYRLGNRAALDWILDQHKEKTPKDPTIREKFNSYRFADHKEKVADLIARVTRVALETLAITNAMRALRREAP